jgi:hypothetical protein
VPDSCTGSSAACPADEKEEDGTTCSDGTVCTQTDSCQGGTCTGSNPMNCEDNNGCTADSCDPEDGCQYDATPLNTCLSADKSILILKQKDAGAKDKLIWKWIKGLATIQEEFADPITTADYTLCVYAGASDELVEAVSVPPSFDYWTPLSTKGYKYKDQSASASGIQKVILKGSTGNKVKILMKGKGVGLPDPPVADNPTLAFDLPVLVQMVNTDSGLCFEAEYDSADVKKNVPAKFKAKAQ